jgi:hypothetical protein
MFPPNTPMTLTHVTFTTEEVEEETRRVVVMTFAIAPFTATLAEALNVRSVLFGSGGPKDAIETAVVHIDAPLQRMTWAMAPDQDERRIVLKDVVVVSKLRAKVKHDRDPAVMDAAIKFSVRYPDAETLLYIATGVNDTHYITLEAEQGNLLTSVAEGEPPARKKGRRVDPPDVTGDELRPGVHAQH